MRLRQLKWIHDIGAIKYEITYELMSLLHVRSLQTSNDRGAQVHVVNDVDETLGNSIASDDTAKDVDEDSSDLGVASDEVES